MERVNCDQRPLFADFVCGHRIHTRRGCPDLHNSGEFLYCRCCYISKFRDGLEIVDNYCLQCQHHKRDALTARSVWIA